MAAQTHGDPEEFTAFAVNMGALTGAGATAQLIMTINRWSTQAERDALFTTLKEKGSGGAARRSCSAPSGSARCRTPNSIGYDIRLALEEPGKDGGRRVLLVTDRPVGFRRGDQPAPRSTIRSPSSTCRCPPKGFGQGTMSIAAKIIPAGRTVLVENYDTQPVQLNRIETRKLTKR